MRQGGDLEERVTRAEAHVRAALHLWRADQPDRCDECCLSLQAAIRELDDVQPAPLGGRLKRLQADIDRLTRMVDSAAAFCRGMALTIGRDGSGLDALPGIEGVA